MGKILTQEIYNQAHINYNIIADKDNIYWIKWDEVIIRTSKRLCLLCDTDLDKDIGKGKWHIPLCKNHRTEELKKTI